MARVCKQYKEGTIVGKKQTTIRISTPVESVRPVQGFLL
jgi:hypothetical protein